MALGQAFLSVNFVDYCRYSADASRLSLSSGCSSMDKEAKPSKISLLFPKGHQTLQKLAKLKSRRTPLCRNRYAWRPQERNLKQLIVLKIISM